MAYVHVTLRGWVSAFVFTQAVEIPVYVTLLRRALKADLAKRPQRLPLQILLAFGASAITHPVVWFVLPRLEPSFTDPGPAYIEYVIRAESFALVIEALYFYTLCAARFRHALLASLLANGLSASIGMASRSLFGFP